MNLVTKVYSSTEVDELVLAYYINKDNNHNRILQTHVKNDYIKHDYFIGTVLNNLSDGEYFYALKATFKRLGYQVVEITYTINEFNEVCYYITQMPIINKEENIPKKRLVK